MTSRRPHREALCTEVAVVGAVRHPHKNVSAINGKRAFGRSQVGAWTDALYSAAARAGSPSLQTGLHFSVHTAEGRVRTPSRQPSPHRRRAEATTYARAASRPRQTRPLRVMQPSHLQHRSFIGSIHSTFPHMSYPSYKIFPSCSGWMQSQCVGSS